MKNEKLENTILKDAERFKKRADIKDIDEKRHDPILQDEQVAMFFAHDKLKWEYSQIASAFNRDIRMVEKHVNMEQGVSVGKKDKLQKKNQASKRRIQQQLQKEHIEMLQQMARTALSSLPERPPDFFSAPPEVFDSLHSSLAKMYCSLINDPNWDDMACHLGDQSETIIWLSNILIYKIPACGNSLQEPEYKEYLIEAWDLIKGGGLRIISESSDTWKWEYLGLKRKCPNCKMI